MTATVDEVIVGTVPDYIPFDDLITETETKPAVPCKGWLTEVKCDNEAKFKIRLTCCSAVIFLCEDCLLDFKAHLLRNLGEMGRCNECGKPVTLSPSLAVYLGRIS